MEDNKEDKQHRAISIMPNNHIITTYLVGCNVG